MNFPQFVFHVMGLLLPALAMAVFMPLAGRWVMGPCSLSGYRRALVHAAAGSAVLVLGLVLQGHDGRMTTYLALVLLSGSLEWGMHRGWRRS